MSDALALVKEHCGADAIIVSTQSNVNDGVRVTAAVDEDPATPAALEPVSESGQDPLDVISEALNYHNVPAALADTLEQQNIPPRIATRIGRVTRHVEPSAKP